MAVQKQRYRFKAQSLNDEMGNYNLSNSGATFFSSPKPPGANDNSRATYYTGDYIYAASSPYTSPATVFTCSLWLKTDRASGASTGWDCMIGYGTGTANANYGQLSFDNVAGKMEWGHGHQSGVKANTFLRRQNVWDHYVFINHGGYIAASSSDFYRNGVKETSKTVAGAFVASAFNNNQRHGLSGLYSLDFRGYIWDIRSWDYELTDAQVKAVYQSYFDDGAFAGTMA